MSQIDLRNTGLAIRACRQAAGLTQAQLATAIGTGQPAVSRWESGRDEPRLSTMRAIARTCGHQLVLEAEDSGVDRAQIRQHLAMTHEQRLDANENFVRMVAGARLDR